MVRKIYGGDPHAITSEELELVQKLAKSDEKELLALILIQLGRLNGHLAQIEGRLSESTFMEREDLSGYSPEAAEALSEREPDFGKSGFEMVMAQLKDINAQLESIAHGLKTK
jgi:hypothetical protein